MCSTNSSSSAWTVCRRWLWLYCSAHIELNCLQFHVLDNNDNTDRERNEMV
jgi:hypothetical protein